MVIKKKTVQLIHLVFLFTITSCADPTLAGKCFQFEDASVKEVVCFNSKDTAEYQIYYKDKIIFTTLSPYSFNSDFQVVEINKGPLNNKALQVLRDNEYSCIGRLLGKVENLNSWFFKPRIYRHNKLEIDCSLVEIN